MIKKLIFLCLGIASLHAGERMYFDISELDVSHNMMLHRGENVWIEVKSIHTDGGGVYVCEDDIVSNAKGWEKHWKCPYCYRCYPMGQACNNPDCPSKY